MEKTLYIKYDVKDKFERPIAVADSPSELARMLGNKPSTVYSEMSKGRHGYLKIEVEFEEGEI